jgi:hypothetical protein
LKEVYGNRVASLPNRLPWLYNQFRRSTKQFGGKYFLFPVHFEGGQSVGSIGDDEELPGGGSSKEAQGETTSDAKVYDKYHYGLIKITGPAIEHARRNVYAFVTTKNFEIRNKTEWLVSQLNGQMYRDGLKMATIKTDNASGNYTIEDNDNIRHFRVGMRVDAYATGWTAKRNATAGTGQGKEITVVNPDDNSITLAADQDEYAATDYIVREDTINAGSESGGPVPTDGVEMTGLRSIIDDDTDGPSVFQGIDRSVAANAAWKANVLRNAGTPRPLTLDLLQQAEDTGELASGIKSDMAVTGYGQRRKYIQLLIPDVRYAPQVLKGGFRVLQFNDKPVYVDKDAMPEEWYFMVRRNYNRFTVRELGILDNAGPAERIAGRDVYEIVIGGYFNLGVEKTNCEVRLVDLLEP